MSLRLGLASLLPSRLREGSVVVMLAMVLAPPAFAAPSPDIIDMHFHAESADSYGPGAAICAPYPEWPPRDPAEPIAAYTQRMFVSPACPNKLVAPPNDAALVAANVAVLRRRNILAVASGPAADVEALRAADPAHVLSAIEFGDAQPWPAIAELRALHAAAGSR